MTLGKRNFWGGFLGGVLGILACVYLHPSTLVVGCFVGVTIGFWNGEIIGKIRSTQQRFQLAKIHISKMRDLKAEKVIVLSGVVLVLAHLAFMLVGHFLLGERGLYGSLFKSLSPALWACFLFALESTWSSREKAVREYGASSLWLFLKCAMFTLLKELWYMGRVTAIIVYSILAVFVGIIAIIAVVLPVGIISGFFWAIKKTGHWFCFGITVAVTALAAVIGYQYWTNIVGVWITALAAGSASGATAYASHPYVLQPKTPKIFHEKSSQLMTDCLIGFLVDTGSCILKWFLGHKPVFA